MACLLSWQDALPDVLVVIVVIRLLLVLLVSGRLCAHAFSGLRLRWQASVLLLPSAVLPCAVAAVNEYNNIPVCRSWRIHVRVLLPQLSLLPQVNIVDLI